MKIVLTGSSSGIGLELTKHLLAKGHLVWGLARSDQREFVRNAPGRFFATRCDVSDWARVHAAAAEITAQWSGLDALITCAGLQGEIGPATTVDPLKWSATIRANLDGTYFAIRAFYEGLLRAGNRSKIICFSGGGATKARPHFSAYGVAKAGVVRLVETIAEELIGQAIDINAIAPGAINTRLTDEVIALGPTVSGKNEYEAAVKQKATGGSSIEKAIGLVEWLLSAESNGLTGRLISAPWDPWAQLTPRKIEALSQSDVYQLRRIVPEERGIKLD